MIQTAPQKQISPLNPLKVATWIGIISIIMLFAALSSAYIVRKADGNWLDFNLPNAFWITTGIICLSSFSMHWAVVSAKKNQFSNLNAALWITTLLGIAFVAGQFLGWVELVEAGVYFTDNPSSSFLYVFTGIHGLHLLGGIITLIVVAIKAALLKYNSSNFLGIQLCATYWHFLGVLWIYLFFFLLLNN